MVGSSRYSVRRSAFPIRKVSADFADSEWAQSTTGLDSEGVRKFLAWRWPVPADPTLALLRQKFLTYCPVGIVTYDLQDYVQLDHPAVIGVAENLGDSYYVALPIQQEEVEAGMKVALASCGTRGFLSTALVEFYSLFPHLREAFETCGHFIPPEKWKSLAEEMEGVSTPTELAGRHEALMIYHAVNGDMIALSPTGEVAWYCLSESEIIPIADCFSGFLRYFIEHMDKRWPLDSYGP